MASLDIRHDGQRVVVAQQGRTLLDLPWDAALALGNALREQGKRAEETAKADGIARDQAFLLRLGVPVGLTNHPAIRQEAAKLAAWDSDLRRYLPGGVRSQEQFGTPGVIRHAPQT